MSRFPRSLQTVLAPAVTAGRAALRDLDDDEVPAGLRRVAAHSGGRLPPPLAVSLLEAIDDDEWLREKATEQLTGDIGEDDPAAQFLRRPAGWWSALAVAGAAAAADAEARRADQAERRAEQLRGKIDDAKRKHKDAQRDARAATSDLKAQLTATRRELKAAQAAEGADAAELETAIGELEQALHAAEAARSEVQSVLADQRNQLRRLRRERAAAERKARSGGAASFVGDATEMARVLDHMAAGVRLRRAREETADPTPVPESRGSRFTLPPGVSPDSPDAVAWLVGQGTEFTLIVDGYNVLFHLDRSDFSTGRARQRLGHELSRLRREAGRVRVIVVYDSALPGARRSRPTPGGIDVRFAEEDRLADEEVILLAGEIPGPIVVVSSDREVREGSEGAGALTLWSEALVGWITVR